MSTPLTTQIAQEASPELLRSAVDQKITKVRPMATPIDQISRVSGAHAVDSMEVAYYTVDQKATSTTLSAAASLSGKDPKENVGKILKVSVADSSIFDKSDTVMFPAHTLAGSENTYLTAYVTDVAEGSVTLCFPAEADNDINKDDFIVRMGRAATELDVQTAQYVAVPRRSTNYCQIFKMQVEQSTLMRLSGKEVPWTFSEQEEAAVIDMRLGMEKNFLFGTKGRFLDAAKNEYVYLTGGIWSQAGRDLKFDLDDASAESFIDLAREVFTGNNGSRKRLLVGGSEFICAISKMKASEKVILGPMHNRWNLETREIVTNFGSFYILHSEVFDQCGHGCDALVLDQQFIIKFSHIPFQPEKLDLRAAGSRNTDAVVLTEASCLVLRNPSAHARIKGLKAK